MLMIIIKFEVVPHQKAEKNYMDSLYCTREPSAPILIMLGIHLKFDWNLKDHESL